MADATNGMKTAVEATTVEEFGAALQGFQRAEQLALLPTPVAIEDATAAEEAAQRRGPGRPVGSKNKRTADWIDFILGRYRSPLLFLAETYSRPVEDLARELGCKPKEAFEIQVAAARDLAPYVHQKQPMAVEVSSQGLVQLVIQTGLDAPGAVPIVGEVTIEGTIVTDQQVSDDPSEPV